MLLLTTTKNMKQLFAFILTSMLLMSCDPLFMRMTSKSMEGTINEGDLVWVNPTKQINKNQIVAFNHNDQLVGEQVWIFRVIAISGDKIEIKSGEVFINDKKTKEPETLKFSYKVLVKGFEPPSFLEKLEYTPLSRNAFIVHMTNDEKTRLSETPQISGLEPILMTKGIHQKNIYMSDSINNWNTDNFGPIKIPKSQVGKPDAENLYFLMGDNRHNSLDSRYFGFVKESDIIGIVNE